METQGRSAEMTDMSIRGRSLMSIDVANDRELIVARPPAGRRSGARTTGRPTGAVNTQTTTTTTEAA